MTAIAVLNGAIDKTFTPEIMDMVSKARSLDIRSVGMRKKAVFILSSSIDTAGKKFLNIFYSDLFRELFALAEARKDECLKVPVHVICDDFACSGRIEGFEEWISVFRAAGISTTLLLQDESQLKAMYGEYGAATIINNCDTYVYFGGMDLGTIEHISRRGDFPLERIASMKPGEVAIIRRGMKPFLGKRYATFSDPVYEKYISGSADNEEPGHDAAF